MKSEIEKLQSYYVWHLASNGKLCNAEVIGDKIIRDLYGSNGYFNGTIDHSLFLNCPIDGKIWKNIKDCFKEKDDLIEAITYIEKTN